MENDVGSKMNFIATVLELTQNIYRAADKPEESDKARNKHGEQDSISSNLE